MHKSLPDAPEHGMGSVHSEAGWIVDQEDGRGADDAERQRDHEPSYEYCKGVVPATRRTKKLFDKCKWKTVETFLHLLRKMLGKQNNNFLGVN